MEKQALIELHNVALHYRRKRKLRGSSTHKVLNDISFNIYPGETVGVIGRNGAGKSTLLRLMAHIIEPDRGHIVRRADRISLLAYQVGFNNRLSGRENAIQTAMLQGMSKDDIIDRMDKVIEFSGLESMIDEPISSYSAGMRARLGFSISLQLEPDVLLIDEMLGVGDYEFRKKSNQALNQRMRSDKTVVLVSHVIDTVKKLCDRAVWIENGRVVLIDKPGAVLDHYHRFDEYIAQLAKEQQRSEVQLRNELSEQDPLDLLAQHTQKSLP